MSQYSNQLDCSLNSKMIGFLRENFFNRSRKVLLKDFNERFGINISLNDLNVQLREMNLIETVEVKKRYKAFLSEHFNLSHEELTNLFNAKFKTNYSVKQIAQRCRSFGLIKNKINLTDEQISFLKGMSGKSRLATLNAFKTKFNMNVSLAFIKTKCLELGVLPHRKKGVCFSKSQIEFIEKNFDPMATAKFTNLRNAFNCNFGTNYASFVFRHQCLKMNLHKPIITPKASNQQLTFLNNKSHLKRTELHKIFNKKYNLDLSFDQFSGLCSRYKIYGDRRKEFQISRNAPIGFEKLNSNGYVLVKVGQPYKFVFKHHKVWEEANGPVKEGYVISFKDGNKRNCKLDNLIMINPGEFMRLLHAKYFDQPTELKDTVFLISKMNQALSEIDIDHLV